MKIILLIYFETCSVLSSIITVSIWISTIDHDNTLVNTFFKYRTSAVVSPFELYDRSFSVYSIFNYIVNISCRTCSCFLGKCVFIWYFQKIICNNNLTIEIFTRQSGSLFSESFIRSDIMSLKYLKAFN